VIDWLEEIKQILYLLHLYSFLMSVLTDL